MITLDDIGVTEAEERELRRAAKPLLDALRDLPLDEWEALLHRALINCVATGRIAEGDFVSPEDYRRFCEKYEVTPPMSEEEADEMAVAWIRKRFPNAPEELADWDRWPAR
jgi:hypothetical protein